MPQVTVTNSAKGCLVIPIHVHTGQDPHLPTLTKTSCNLRLGWFTRETASLERPHLLPFLETFLPLRGFVYAGSLPLLVDFSLYAGQCLLVIPTWCHLLEKIKHIILVFFLLLPMARQWWLAGKCLNKHWHSVSLCSVDTLGFFLTLSGASEDKFTSGLSFPSSSRNWFSLLRITRCQDWWLRWLLVVQAERMNLT